jgi:glycerol uptake facilitator protein
MTSFSIWRRSIAELFGTAMLVLIGPGAAAFNAILLHAGHQAPSLADVGVVSLAFAIVVTAMVYSIGPISGAHINPAVSVGLAVAGRFPWRDVGWYVVAQLVGGVLGAFGIVLVLGHVGATVGNLGATVLAPTTGYVRGMAIEAVEAFVLMWAIMGSAVEVEGPSPLAGLVIGLTVGGIIMMTAGPTGSSFNPARTFGPYVGDSLFGGHVSWLEFPLYVVGPCVGASIASLTFQWIKGRRMETATLGEGEPAAKAR